MNPRTLLHVGCSYGNIQNTTDGFQDGNWKEIRLDIDPRVKPDVIGSLLDLSAVPNNSIDAIYSSHNIEHVYHHQIPIALSEFKRVLHPDGFVVLTCPDLQSICALVVDDKLEDSAYMSEAGPITALDMIYGFSKDISQGNEFMSHKTGFTKTSLHKHFSNAHFKEIYCYRRPQHYDLWVLATKSQWTNKKRKNTLKKHLGHLKGDILL